MGKRATPAVVGAFVVGAVVILVTAVALFGSGRLFRTTYPYVVYFTGDVNGLNVGAPVKFKGVELGSVEKILLGFGETGDADVALLGMEDVRIPVVIELDEGAMQRRGAAISPDPQTVKRLVDAGLRAELSMESFVTGVLYVKLDIDPTSEAMLVGDPTVPLMEIPSRRTKLEEVERQAAKFLARLDELDLESLIDGLSSTVSGIDRLVNSPDLAKTIATLPRLGASLDHTIVELGETATALRTLSAELGSSSQEAIDSLQKAADNAAATLATARTTLESVNAVVSPESPILYQFGRSLEEFAGTTRALRRFAEEMERNPTVLLRGKATEPLK